MDIAELIRQKAFYEAGGKDAGNSTADQFAKGLGLVKGIGDTYLGTIKQVLANKQAQLESKKIIAETEKLDKGNQPVVEAYGTPHIQSVLDKSREDVVPPQGGFQGWNQFQQAIMDKRQGGIEEASKTARDMSAKFGNMTVEQFKDKAQGERFLSEAGVGPGEKNFKVANDLRQEFIKIPQVKDFITVNGKVNQLDALIKTIDTDPQKSRAGIDQALVTIFNRILDPDSTVREAEFARTPEGIAVINRFMGKVEQFTRGGVGLTDSDRRQLVADAKVIANETGKYFNSQRDAYTTLSQKMGVDPELVTGTIPGYQEQQIERVETSQVPPPPRAPLTPEDQEALNWATLNASDPRAAEIRKRLGR